MLLFDQSKPKERGDATVAGLKVEDLAYILSFLL